MGGEDPRYRHVKERHILSPSEPGKLRPQGVLNENQITLHSERRVSKTVFVRRVACSWGQLNEALHSRNTSFIFVPLTVVCHPRAFCTNTTAAQSVVGDARPTFQSQRDTRQTTTSCDEQARSAQILQSPFSFTLRDVSQSAAAGPGGPTGTETETCNSVTCCP